MSFSTITFMAGMEYPGHFSFEEVFVPTDLSLCHLEFVIMLSLTNAHLAYDYFVKKIVNHEFGERKFVQAAMVALMEDLETEIRQ